MSTKFFTNYQENTLLKKFAGVFEHTDVHYFDALVGYFRSSGYFRIRKHLENVTQIRILVGINVDKLIRTAARKGLEFNLNSEITIDEVKQAIREDIQHSDYDKEVEEGIIQFIEDVASGKIKIRAHPEKNIHAKIYIFRQKIEHEHAGYGSVITGSSNLTVAGIEKNFEFNVELRDYDDIKFATDTFNKLWVESVEILSEEIQNVRTATYLNDEFTPFEIFIKLLIEHFGKSIEYDPESITDLPPGYRKLAYQIDAVNDGYNKLMQHNGFILADVVGLGKTIVAVIIAKKFYFSNGYRTKILVVHPPALERIWRKAVRDFEVPNVDFITNGSLHKIRHPEDYDLVIVDEAHKFRSDESAMFHELQKLCKTPRRRSGIDGSKIKKVILVTATPLNNRPEDIRNQLYLFQDAKRSTLEVGNLQHFFRPLIDKYRKLKKEKDRAKITLEVKKIYDQIRRKVLEPIIVRRTRTDILQTPEYYEDIRSQNLTFPTIAPPRPILYQLDENLNQLYDETVTALRDTRNGLGYYRYQALKFLKADLKQHYKQADLISEQLAIIMKFLLVKRIDSSFHAFKMSLKRFHDANLAMGKMLENDRIYIAPKLKVNEFILKENEAELEQLLLNSDDPDLIQCFRAEDFEPEFVDGIHRDLEILKNLKDRWEQIDTDPKYDVFLEKLRTEFFSPEVNSSKKLIVFSEAKETTDYLVDRLKKDGFDRILGVDSSNLKDVSERVAQNFDANLPAGQQLDDIQILISTEVLAEGINLHRSHVVVNYDIPWNATRLMQRIGRVNRIGTQADTIYIYNFFPTVETDNEIDLNKKAFMKLQSFHSALGEDSQIYTTEEEYGTFGLFEKIPEEEKDERLEYLMFLRHFRETEPEWFKKIRDQVPLRARSGRKDKTRTHHTIAYIKDHKRDCFYYLYDDLRFDELTFIEAVKIFKADVSERPVALHELHHDQITAAVRSFKTQTQLQALGVRSAIKLGPNDQRAIGFLNDMMKQEFTNELEKATMESAKHAIKIGRFQKLPRELNKLLKQAKEQRIAREILHQKLMRILKYYPLLEQQEAAPATEVDRRFVDEKNMPQIIISESFIEG